MPTGEEVGAATTTTTVRQAAVAAARPFVVLVRPGVIMSLIAAAAEDEADDIRVGWAGRIDCFDGSPVKSHSFLFLGER